MTTTPAPHFKEQHQPNHEEIARRAYEIYVTQGKPCGHAMDHWLCAEKELRLPVDLPVLAAPKARTKPSARVAMAIANH
ncbi:MAG: DUF2934 domain-containing protein [Planctomycetes bacterium]|nr:DUF2934 domain-containing protein [Planctomycetota bacterium]